MYCLNLQKKIKKTRYIEPTPTKRWPFKTRWESGIYFLGGTSLNKVLLGAGQTTNTIF